MKGDRKLLIENPLSHSGKLQVWSSWKEDEKQILKHLGKVKQNSSVWNNDVDRIEIQNRTITDGRGKFRSPNRIDFVLKNDVDVGLLKKSGQKTRFVYVELVRKPLHHKKHESSFHGFPISKEEFLAF